MGGCSLTVGWQVRWRASCALGTLSFRSLVQMPASPRSHRAVTARGVTRSRSVRTGCQAGPRAEDAPVAVRKDGTGSGDGEPAGCGRMRCCQSRDRGSVALGREACGDRQLNDSSALYSRPWARCSTADVTAPVVRGPYAVTSVGVPVRVWFFVRGNSYSPFWCRRSHSRPRVVVDRLGEQQEAFLRVALRACGDPVEGFQHGHGRGFAATGPAAPAWARVRTLRPAWRVVLPAVGGCVWSKS